MAIRASRRATLRSRLCPALVTVLAGALDALLPAAGQAQWRFFETPVAFERVSLAGVRIPTSGYLVIDRASEWQELWRRYQTRESRNTGAMVPPFDFTSRRLVVVGYRGDWCSKGPLIQRVFARRDTVIAVSASGPRDWPGCATRFAVAEAAAIARDARPIRALHNAIYSTWLPRAPWFQERRLADLDTIPEPGDRAGWLEHIARTDTTAANVESVVAAVIAHGGGNVILALPWVRRDSAAVRTLMLNGATWTPEATRLMVETDGLGIVADSKADGAALDLMAHYLIGQGQRSPLLDRIAAHPAIAGDTALQHAIERSGLVSRRP